MILELRGQIRGGKNNQGIQAGTNKKTGKKFVRKFPNKSFSEWAEEAKRQINEQLKPIRPAGASAEHVFFDSFCKIHIQYWPMDRKRRDSPAILDAIYHVLEKTCVVADDSLFIEEYLEPMGLSKDDPKAVIIIETRPAMPGW